MQSQADERVLELEDAFKVFSQMSVQLEDSYRQLEKRVAELNEELVAARSERLRQLAEKERLADRLERLLSLLPGGVVLLDESGIIRECNPAALELLGSPLIGELWQSLVKKVFVTNSEDIGEVSLKNGTRLSLTSRQLGNEPGQIVLLMDVSEQFALREMVGRNKKLSAMGEMAASLAHQIRTPLASALLYISHVANPNLEYEDRNRFTKKVRSRLLHLDRMINDMLRFVRGAQLDMLTVKLDDFLNDFSQAAEHQLQLYQATLELDSRRNFDSSLYCNVESLQGALLNLVTNAIQAGGTGTKLVLRTRNIDTGYLEIALSDNGPGISNKIQKKIFSPFFTTRPEGIGLGLAVVQTIVAAHQGSITVESKPGMGTCFRIKLPRSGLLDALPSAEGTCSDTIHEHSYERKTSAQL